MTETTEQQNLTCPKCGTRMQHITVDECTIDRCEKCFGIWVEAGERVKLMKSKDVVRSVDVGSPEVGERHDVMRNIECPRCGQAMHHVEDRAQKHIGYERCAKCQGSFFDAGELADLSEFTLAERIKAFFGKA
ncbi:MAG: zf-TFIIB domain-containing protein [Planctomycetota bacterium]|jgi:Zn-finger nucleic acid-binding protein